MKSVQRSVPLARDWKQAVLGEHVRATIVSENIRPRHLPSRFLWCGLILGQLPGTIVMEPDLYCGRPLAPRMPQAFRVIVNNNYISPL